MRPHSYIPGIICYIPGIICGHPASIVETKLDGACVSCCATHTPTTLNTIHEVLREIRRKHAARNFLAIKRKSAEV
jgi:hypothetical protein